MLSRPYGNGPAHRPIESPPLADRYTDHRRPGVCPETERLWCKCPDTHGIHSKNAIRNVEERIILLYIVRAGLT